MKLLDSNILIYAAKAKEYPELKSVIAGSDVFISEMSRLEVLGFHGLSTDDKQFFEKLFSLIGILPIDKPIIDKAIEIRQLQKKTKVGDAIIAATALLKGLVLVTANVDDFKHLSEISIDNPIVRQA